MWMKPQGKTDISKMTRRHYHLQKKDVQYINIKKKILVSGRMLRSMVWFFAITSGQILCWVLVMLLCGGYHVAVMYV